MFSILNIAASGLSATSSQLGVTAGNIANMSSTGYKARQVNLTSSPAGVSADSVSIDSTSAGVDEEGNALSNVDPVKESVDLIRERQQYTADVKLLKVGSQMLGSLLDVMAK